PRTVAWRRRGDRRTGGDVLLSPLLWRSRVRPSLQGWNASPRAPSHAHRGPGALRSQPVLHFAIRAGGINNGAWVTALPLGVALANESRHPKIRRTLLRRRRTRSYLRAT